MKNIIVSFFVGYCFFPLGIKSQPVDVRIGWNYRTYQELRSYTVKTNNTIVKSAHYPRIKRLSGGDLLMIYMDGKFGWNIYARKSKDDGLTWSDAVIVRQSYKDPGKNDNVCYACPDFIELPDGKIMVAYQWRYNNGYNDLENTNSNCGIEIIQSINQGESFIAASAKKAFWGRNWEPSFILLPTGELQLFCTDTHTLKCNVGLLRSFDYGKTWLPATSSTFSETEYISRTQEGEKTMDGMAVGQYLDNDNGIAIAVECDGGTQTPWIVWTSKENNWRYADFQAPMIGPGEDRKWLVHENFRGFAPYMMKLPTGEIVVQSNGKFKNETAEKMWVFIGNDKAKDFSYASSPYAAWWGSISYIGNDEVISSGNSGYKENGADYQMLKVMKGVINRSKKVQKGDTECVDLDKFDRSLNNDWFIGGKSQAQAYLNLEYTDKDLNVNAHVFDKKLNYYSPLNCDGLQLLVYRKNKVTLSECVYRLTININGGTKLELQNGGGGFDQISTEGFINNVNLEGSLNNNEDQDIGYTSKSSVLWTLIGGYPSESDEFRVHLIQKNNDNSTAVLPVTTEDMPGEKADNPTTWLPIYFVEDEVSSVKSIGMEKVKVFITEDKMLNVDFDKGLNGAVRVGIYDVKGICFFSHLVYKPGIITIPTLGRGVYCIVSINDNGEQFVKKIII